MNCRNWEERIALAAGGDLDAPAAQELEQHLAACPACREVAEAYRWSRETAQSAHAEEIHPAHYAAIRARVLEKLEKRGGWRWTWASAGALFAAGAFALLMVHTRPAPEREPARVAVTQSHSPESPTLEPKEPPHSRRPALQASVAPPRQRARPEAEAAPSESRAPRVLSVVQADRNDPESPFMMRVATSDPNVVVYVLTN